MADPSVTAHRFGIICPESILAACAAWQRVHGLVPQREALFRCWAAAENRTTPQAYPLQRVCWERGWLVVGTCEVTADGWAVLNGEAGAEGRRAA